MNIKQFIAVSAFVSMTLMTVFSNIQIVSANAGAAVVINEVAWAGSEDSASDEWLELYNNTNEAINLAGWSIVDDGSSTYTIEDGIIPAKGYFLIEDHEDSVTTYQSDAIISLSFANSGDSLQLLDSAGNEVDIVNSTGGEWFAGDGGIKASMERIDPMQNGNDPLNWEISEGSGDIASAGSAIIGTPGRVNSVFAGIISSFSMNTVSDMTPGEIIIVNVTLNDAEDVFAYGLDLIYNPNQLRYVDAIGWGALSNDEVETNFQAALQDDELGHLVIGQSRLDEFYGGIDVNGTVARVQFEVIGNNEEQGIISFGNESYVTNTDVEIDSLYNNFAYTIGGQQNMIEGVQMLSANLEENGGIYLTWQSVENASSYVIERKNIFGEYVILGEIEGLDFTDESSLNGFNHEYRVAAKNGDQQGEYGLVEIIENRFMVADIDKSNRVDGKDLEMLARVYGYEYGEDGYSIYADLNYDAVVDGLDLLLLAENFGITN